MRNLIDKPTDIIYDFFTTYNLCLVPLLHISKGYSSKFPNNPVEIHNSTNSKRILIRNILIRIDRIRVVEYYKRRRYHAIKTKRNGKTNTQERMVF